PGQIADDSRSGNDEYFRPADRAQALGPVHQLERDPLKSNSKDARDLAPRRTRAGPLCGSLIDCFRGESRDVMACPHLLRGRAETQQLRSGPARQNLFDNRLQSTFVAQVTGPKVSVEADFNGPHRFRGPIGHVVNSPWLPAYSPAEGS